jgi:hypothetical protein
MFSLYVSGRNQIDNLRNKLARKSTDELKTIRDKLFLSANGYIAERFDFEPKEELIDEIAFLLEELS